MNNPFFKNHGPFILFDLLKNNFNINYSLNNSPKNEKLIEDIRNLDDATSTDITFFHSIKYKDLAQKTKAIACITKKEFLKFLPNDCIKITSDNILLQVALVTAKFYPDSIIDNNNTDLESIDNKFKNIISGKNTFIGKNVSIGEGTTIGYNSIIENNVLIGKGCFIGSNVVIRNSIIEDDVHILDGAIIGKKGFGFFPKVKKNFRYPHVGYVYLKKIVKLVVDQQLIEVLFRLQ
jgi:UDP-3-O-[3-hydroxymyristoyl] glucosamine N-acyltransferase